MSRGRIARRRVTLIAGVGVVALLVVLFARSGSQYLEIFGGGPNYQHKLQLTVPSASEAIHGERVTEAGLDAGSILSANVTPNGEAHLVLGISNRYWPVPTDTQLALREGGTIKATDRYISLTPGKSNLDFADDASVPASQFTVPVEYDQLFDVFNGATRAGLVKTFDYGGPDLAKGAPAIRSALGDSAPALGETAAVFSDLGYSQQALSTLVSSTATVSDAVQASNPGLQTLITGSANTFGTVASQSTELKTALTYLPKALHDDGRLFGHGARTFARVAVLTGKLHSGITQLNAIADPLDNTLYQLMQVEPSAVSTLDTVNSSGSKISSLLVDARTTLLPKVTSLGTQAAKVLDCVRPFTPDIVDFVQGWGSFLGDGISSPNINTARLLVSLEPWTNTTTETTAQLEQTFPNLHIQYPQAPGNAYNQPWYQPQCGITASDTNPADDSDAHTFDPQGEKLSNYGPTTTPDYGPINEK